MKNILVSGLTAFAVLMSSSAAIAQQKIDECEQLVYGPGGAPKKPAPAPTPAKTPEKTPGKTTPTVGKPGSPVPVSHPTTTIGGQGVVTKGPTVKTGGLQDPMRAIMDDIYRTARQIGMPVPVITSARDSVHGDGSLHYSGMAVDLRCNPNYASGSKCRAWENALQAAIGRKYQVFFETFKDSSNNHIHIEYDPK